jgi:6-pyruvoyltetrahydropterin/6-carboxytetrahydropterin synthase
MKVGIVEHIDCAHFLPGHPKCGTLHGHTYRIEMTVEGKVENGMVIDFSDLKAKAREILAAYDHQSWNDALDYPSVENICALLNTRLQTTLPYRFSLKVWEGEGKWAEI